MAKDQYDLVAEIVVCELNISVLERLIDALDECREFRTKLCKTYEGLFPNCAATFFRRREHVDVQEGEHT